MDLSRSPDPLPSEFGDAFSRARSRFGRLGNPLLYFSSIGSTNDVASVLAEQQNEGAVVLADAQTAGRGRRGRQWFSPPASGLYLSVVLEPGRARADPQ